MIVFGLLKVDVDGVTTCDRDRASGVDEFFRRDLALGFIADIDGHIIFGDFNDGSGDNFPFFGAMVGLVLFKERGKVIGFYGVVVLLG